jgi:hypothetical protein
MENPVEFGRALVIVTLMRRSLLILLFAVLLGVPLPVGAATGRVLKVLPQFLDLKGRNSISPSLYDRDAYQAHLRQHPEARSARRFYVQWKPKAATGTALKLRIELRGVTEGNFPRQKTLEADVKPGTWGRWTELTLAGADYKSFGEVTAWRATLWEGETLLDEQKSFLW